MSEKTNTKLTAEGWLRFFAKADLLTKQLAEAKSKHARSILIGKFLGRNVGRQVPIQVNGRSGLATLRVEPDRSNQKRYFFEVVWDSIPEQPAPPEAPTDKVSTATDKTARGTKKLAPPGPNATAKPGTGGTAVKAPNDVPVAAKTPPKPAGAGNDEVWD